MARVFLLIRVVPMVYRGKKLSVKSRGCGANAFAPLKAPSICRGYMVATVYLDKRRSAESSQSRVGQRPQFHTWEEVTNNTCG